MIAAVRAAARYRDLVLALGLAAFGYVELLTHSRYEGQPVWPGNEAVSVVVIAALTLPLTVRRRLPLTAGLTPLAVAVIGTAAEGGGQSTAGFLAAIAAVYSGAAYAARPYIVAAAAVVGITAVECLTPENRNVESVCWGLAVVAVAWLLGWAIRYRLHRIGSLEQEAVARDEQHAEAVAAATAAERATIARELHDIVAHAVSVIVIQAQAGHGALPDRPEVAAQTLKTIERSGRSALEELRRLLTLLSDAEPAQTAPAPSLRELDALAERCRAAGLELDVERHGTVPPLGPATELAAYRVIQEALTNTLRHSPEARSRLALHGSTTGVRIVVHDDGHGTAVTTTGLGSGRGLIGMRERVQLCGGRLIAADATDDGFLVEAWLPAAGDPT
jgi:signal transduction histidine kinase